MPIDFSHKKLQKESFKNSDLSGTNFSGADLRGADFTGADLTGADFSKIKTGMTPSSMASIFIVTLVISAISGYFAMLAGRTVQIMLNSTDAKISSAGIIVLVIILFFIVFSIWKGVGKAIKSLVIPVVITASILGILSYLTGAGTGMGMLYIVVSILLVGIMFVVGTVARVAARPLSVILFLGVTIGGSFFSKSLGGGLGTVIMAVACAVISKRAVSGAAGFESLRKVAFYITRKFGTSFRSANLMNTNFMGAKITNSDFTNAEIAAAHWGDSIKINTIINDRMIVEKRHK